MKRARILIILATASPLMPQTTDLPLGIEIISLSRQYLGRKTNATTQVIFRTDATALYELRSGMNCKSSTALAESKYHGVAKPGEATSLSIDANDLKDGLNALSLCFNRDVLENSSSRNLDYQAKVFEKNLHIIVDAKAPEISAHVDEAEDGKRTLEIICADDHGCEKITYAVDNAVPREFSTAESSVLRVNLENLNSANKISITGTDRAGNQSAPNRSLDFARKPESPFGDGRLTILPTYFRRLDSRKDKTPAGAAVILAGDFGLHGFFKKAPPVWLPGVRIEGMLGTFGTGDNTTDITGLSFGPVWLFSLAASKKWGLHFGATAGVSKSLTIYADNTVISATALGLNVFAGIEYQWRNFFVSTQVRAAYIASTLDALVAIGAGLGVGVKF